MNPGLMTLQRAAQVLDITYARAAELARIGILPVVRLGRQVRVDSARLASFIESGGQALPGGWRRGKAS
jgi:excisionase family DNA binding protein